MEYLTELILEMGGRAMVSIGVLFIILRNIGDSWFVRIILVIWMMLPLVTYWRNVSKRIKTSTNEGE